LTSFLFLALGDLAIDHEVEPLLEGECVGIRLPQLHPQIGRALSSSSLPPIWSG
jgi:hypothetical protein